jgi:hypothetical protein
VTHELPLEGFAEAFAELERGEACKLVLLPGLPSGPAATTAAEVAAA